MSRRSTVEQCELCARWRSDVAYVPVHGRNGAQSSTAGHWVCAHCEREAESNWFLAQALNQWAKRGGNPVKKVAAGA